MKCPFCSHLEDKVVDSRPSKDNENIRRRRECISCHRRFTTYEQIEEMNYQVVKKDGRREKFDRNKVIRGLHRALEKRPVSPDQIDILVDEVEHILHTRPERELPTNDIGELIMKRLIELDEIAYVRFASVYRQFRDIHQFYNELRSLLIKNPEVLKSSS